MERIQIGHHQNKEHKSPVMYALVDDEDYEELNQYKWYPQKSGKTFYASRGIKLDGKRTTVLMHAKIMQTPKGLHTDHLDGNGLNNRRSNLRVCTASENAMNRGKPSNNTSGFKGVTRYQKKWQAQIKVNKKLINLGHFSTKEFAHEAYTEACKKYHGEFGRY